MTIPYYIRLHSEPPIEEVIPATRDEEGNFTNSVEIPITLNSTIYAFEIIDGSTGRSIYKSECNIKPGESLFFNPFDITVE